MNSSVIARLGGGNAKNEEIYLDIEENGNIFIKSLLQFKNCRDSEYKLNLVSISTK